MRSIPSNGGTIDSTMVNTTTKRKSRNHNSYDVMGWPIETAIPSILSDWLAYLLKYRILDKANIELQDNEVMTVRFNLGKFQMSRNITPLFSDYPEYVSILKVGEGKLNIWVDGRLTAMIRDGKAYGKIFVKQYDRNLYTTSRLLATEEDDIRAALKLFPRANHHIILNYD